MLVHRTGPGQCEKRTKVPSFLLYNFDIGGDELKREHQLYLRGEATTPLRVGGSVSIVGLASRTGSVAHNQALSERRASRTLDYLREAIPNRFAVDQLVAFGEMSMKREGYHDRVENPRFRSVILFVSSGPKPPSVPPVVDISPEIGIDGLMPGFDVFDTLSKTIDVTQGVAGMIEILPWGTVAEFAGNLGPLLGVVGGVIAMPLLWKGVDDQNLTNGRLEGLWDAMQDMASAFSNRDLITTRVSRWPLIPVPKAHPLVGADVLLNEKTWLRGRQEGAEAAYKMMAAMDRNPVDMTVTLHGRPQKQAVTGRFYLYWIWRGTHGRVAEAIRKLVDTRLRAAGKKEWPLRE